METALSVILGEIVHRSISFLINKFSKEAAALPPDENLRRVLMRLRIIIEEAEGRHIRNQAMLQQLKILYATMYRSYYVLDTFRYRAYSGNDDRLGHVSHTFALSRFNPAKRIQLCGGTSSSSSQGEKELSQLLASLEITITNSSEFMMFLNGCPRLCRRIYSTYLVMERCMFARHVEMDHIINFLMEKASLGTQDLDVLPIVGPRLSGKSTLIEHACNDERVRIAFSQIVLLTEDDLDERLMMTSIRQGGTVKHRSSHAMDNQRILLIVELNGDVDDATWRNLCSSCKRYAANGSSKVIICSRSDEIARFGTAQPLMVEYLTQEAYWYFFKALAFGSTDPKEEPKLTSMAMEIAACINSSFIAANLMARILRTNFSAEFWHKCVSWVKGTRQRDGRIFGAHPGPWRNNKPGYAPRMSKPNEYFWIFEDYQVVYAHDEAQLITIQEVLLAK